MSHKRGELIPVTPDFLEERASRSMELGYPKQKWILFCEYLLQKYKISLREALQTKSKYLYVYQPKTGKPFVVRFSDHMPIKRRELKKDCDFFVGKTHTGYRNYNDAIRAVEKAFSSGEESHVS